jgi:hypothetical protein
MRPTASRVLLVIATAGALVAVLSACGEEGEAGGGSALRFDLPPYVGVSCETPNSVECDRVGVAVRLRPDEPAQRLEAWLNGRRVAMSGRRVTMSTHRQGEGQGRRIWPAKRTWVFEGFLDDAGLDGGPLEVRLRPDGRWLGVPPVRGKLRVVAHYGDGRTASRTVTFHLSPGWG